jgi:hypothetical protein
LAKSQAQWEADGEGWKNDHGDNDDDDIGNWTSRTMNYDSEMLRAGTTLKHWHLNIGNNPGQGARIFPLFKCQCFNQSTIRLQTEDKQSRWCSAQDCFLCSTLQEIQ